jgi:Na+/melibiose symporter-like transporter
VGQGVGGARRVRHRARGDVAGSPTHTLVALAAIRYVTGGGTALFVGIGAVVMLTYPLTEERFREIVVDLTERHRVAAQGAEASFAAPPADARRS